MDGGGKKKRVDERPKRAEFEYFCVFFIACVCVDGGRS